MATITIRNLDDSLKILLRVRAATHDRSMEEEVRAILREALEKREESKGLGSRIHHRFAAIEGIDLDLPKRSEFPRQVDIPQ